MMGTPPERLAAIRAQYWLALRAQHAAVMEKAKFDDMIAEEKARLDLPPEAPFPLFPATPAAAAVGE